MTASHFSPDTWEFVQLLDRHAVEYVVVGGEAVIHYGCARLTGDVDFFYRNDAPNTERLFAALLDFWDGDVPGFSQAEELRLPGQVVQFGRIASTFSTPSAACRSRTHGTLAKRSSRMTGRPCT